MPSSKLCLCDIDGQSSQKEPKVCLAQSWNTQEVWYYFLEYPDVSFQRITHKESLQEWRTSTQNTCTHWVFYNRFPSFRTSEVKTWKQMSSPHFATNHPNNGRTLSLPPFPWASPKFRGQSCRWAYLQWPLFLFRTWNFPRKPVLSLHTNGHPH